MRTMDLNHLHLHVKNMQSTKDFYARYFGFKNFVEHGDCHFMRNDFGFDLAFVEEKAIPEFPVWFHIGFRLNSPDEVKKTYANMKSDGVAFIEELSQEENMIWFKAKDPDGYKVEVYWE